MAKLTLTDLTSLTNEQTAIASINANNAAIETAMENTLSRDGTSPNFMNSVLDMNSNRIINVTQPVNDGDVVTLEYLNNLTVLPGEATKATQQQAVEGTNDEAFMTPARTRDAITDGAFFSQENVNAVDRSLVDKARETVSIFDFGTLTYSDAAHDTAVINAALGYLASAKDGGVLLFPVTAKGLFNSFEIPRKVSIVGEAWDAGHIPQNGTNAAPMNYYADCGSQMRLTAGSSITMRRSSGLKGCVIIRDGLLQPVTNNAECEILVSQFSGTGIVMPEQDARLENCFVLGHNLGINATCTNGGNGRIFIERVMGDNTNGLKLEDWLDIPRVIGCHFWPFMVAHIPEATQAVHTRNGFGYESSNRNDWGTFIDCFAFGYNVGFRVVGTSSNLGFIRCQADHMGTGITNGFEFSGNVQDHVMVGCTSISNDNGVVVDSAHRAGNVRVIGCKFAAINGVTCNNGRVIVVGSDFDSCTLGVGFGPNAGDGSIIANNLFLDCAGVIGYSDNNVRRAVEVWGNQRAGGTPEFHQFTAYDTDIENANPQLTLIDTQGIADVGGILAFVGQYVDGQDNMARIRAAMTSTASGNEAARLAFACQGPPGNLVEYLVLNHAGWLHPTGDNNQNLGDVGNRWATVFAGTGTINTSDEEEKVILGEIDPKVFDAILEVPLVAYQWKNAVEKKGDEARIHYGPTAQAVRDAFLKHGLDPHRYGMFCADQWIDQERVEHEDGSITFKPVPRFNEDGTPKMRYGLRFDQFDRLRTEAIYRKLLNQ